MPSHATISVDNDLSSCQPAVSLWTADYEITGWIDMKQRVAVQPLCWQGRLNDLLANRVPQISL